MGPTRAHRFPEAARDRRPPMARATAPHEARMTAEGSAGGPGSGAWVCAARVAHGQQHEARAARQGQEGAEQDAGEEDGLQRGPVGETRQEEALLGAVVGLREESPSVCKDADGRVTLPLQAKGSPGARGVGAGNGMERGAHGSEGAGWERTALSHSRPEP